ncbi:hypothetical protein [Actinoplanes sp. M2I2]|uniref:hypothetical protein n=1 Tax=Actinoplanes sp. M2I2 TaxID=1734444 RepID=UPI002021A886|nr:hypothetical protein [Actinoplanes sp. M2I2]
MNVVARMLLTEPTPLIIWGTLLALTVPAVLLLGSPEILREPGRALRELFAALRRTTPRASSDEAAGAARFSTLRRGPARPTSQEAIDAVRFATEVQVAADRATAAADQWRRRWEQADQQQTEDWQAWIDADARVRHSLAAAAFRSPWSAPTCEEYAARERFLHRTVAAAVERGDLPAAAMADALAGRQGWDARLHAVEQQLVVDRATAAYRRRRYELSAQAEQAAWRDAGSAEHAARVLRGTAAQAAVRATELRHLLPAGDRAGRRAGTRLVPAPAM